ncbi:hypothetical protein N0V90_004286 [Kalmusia sp. IMI 367209]|nr:hypothetical protein N0V90_004286 [Kalmusia sp. IMI 367209]
MTSQTTTEVDSDDEWYPEPDEGIAQEDDWDYDDWGPDVIQRRGAPQLQWLLDWPGSSVFDGLSIRNSARVAYAVAKAQTCFNIGLKYQTRDLSQQWTEGRWIHWLPQLIALGHVSCLSVKPWTLQRLLFKPESNWWDDSVGAFPDARRNPCTQEYTTVGFCMLALLLIYMETIPRIADDSTDQQTDLGEQFCLPEPNAYYIWEQIDWLLMDTHDIRDFNLTDKYCVILRLIFVIWASQRSSHTPFPSLHRIPLSATLGSPIPFHTSPDIFYDIHLSGSQLLDYLSGEWLGWCKDLSGWQASEVPPPFKNIHFTVRDSHPPYSADIIALVSSPTGEDGWGPFTLEGTVSVEGEIWLTKLYAKHLRQDRYSRTGTTWRYRGAITPFGISGAFEEDTGIHPPSGRLVRRRQGFFWLWKTDWCHDWPRER